MTEHIIGVLNPKRGQTWFQTVAIVVGSAVLFQLASVAATADVADIMADPRRWIISAGLGVVNVAGVSLLALRTAGGLKF